MDTQHNKQLADFSQSAIKKAVVKKTIEHPVVVYPVAFSIVGLTSALMLELGPWVWGSALLGLSVAAVSWFVNYGYRREDFASQYVKLLHKQMEQQRLSRMNQLEDSLNEVDSAEGKSQYKRLTDKFSTFQKMLSKKLNPGELTFSRYLGMAEQVYLGALDNLQNVANMLSTLQVIDVSYVKKRLKALRSEKSENDQREIESLQQRLELYEDQQSKIDSLFSQNEEAMTKIDLTMAAITDMRTSEDHASIDIEAAMAELQQLAARAKIYSNK